MKTKSMVLTLASVAVLGGCVIMPTAPTVVALPGSQKGYDQFRADEDACRSYSQAAVSGSTQAASNYAAGTAVAGTAIGAAAGAIIGSASGSAGPGAAIGAGTGLLFGSLAGADAAGYSSYDLQRRYDVTYVQCMYERGNRVPARFVYRGPPPGYGPGYRAPEQVPPDYVPSPAPQGRVPEGPSA